MSEGLFGARVPRVEDPALLTGKGRFGDDIHLPNMLHACFVRSTFAHALIRSIDTAEAIAMPGVHAVLTLDDLRPLLTAARVPIGMPSSALNAEIDPYVLSNEEVCHVGEPIALVLADDRYLAEDAAERVMVDYDPLPVIADARSALTAEAALARLDCKSNIVGAFTIEYGDCDAAFRNADRVIRTSFKQHKGGGHAVECRAVVARHDPLEDLLTVWDSTQMPHRAHGILVRMLGCAEHNIRIVPPDVGGGFGPKFVFYPEEVAIPAAAKLLGRPIKWIEDRRENFTATVQERNQYWDVEVAVDLQGKLQGIRGSLLHDHGAYTAYGIIVPFNAAAGLIGPYVLPNYHIDAKLALTNMVPVAPTRGAGRPQGTFVMERLLDLIARELEIDRAEVRKCNLITADQMPYVTPIVTRDGAAMTYDSGDYPAGQTLAMEKAGYADFPKRQAAARQENRYIGIGIANYVEGTGRGPFETARVRIGPSGQIILYTGATAQGQGNKTALGQLCAEQFGVAAHDIAVVAGDTGATPLGLGAFASRQAVTAGNSVHLAAVAVREKTLQAAAELLEAATADLKIENGRVSVNGVPDMSVSLGEIARRLAGMPGYAIPGGLAPGLEAEVNFEPETLTYSSGSHIVETDVDPETGLVKILRYVVVHDCGRMINPMIVEGQVLGGVAHGIGNALMEWMGYDEYGQPQTTNYSDYLLPTAPEIPRIEIHHRETPSPLNPLGVKGVGESGTIPAAAAVISAVEDALVPFGVKISETPLTPERIVSLIRP